jgi:pyruvate dehydrogenase E2 component (dihydrolipoamide acetyltransferase)
MAEQAVLVRMPQLGETVKEGAVISWKHVAGDELLADEVLLEVETDKAAIEVPSPCAGTLRCILIEAGVVVPVGTVLAEIQPAAAAADSTPPRARAALRTPAVARRDAQGRPLSPAVRRLLEERSSAAPSPAGSGRDGRLRRRDLMTPSSQPSRLIPFNRYRRRTAEHMVRSKAVSPHVLQAVEVDFSAVQLARAAVASGASGSRPVTILPFVAFATCRALQQFPLLNASIEGDALRVHPGVDLALAVDLNHEGLLAPVVRGADRLGFLSLAAALTELGRKARQNQLTPDELRGGTYTISNSGGFGTLITAPIINQPQVAILSLDSVRKRPVVIESAIGDSIAIRPVGVLAQSFDHRAVDGAYSAAFLRRLREILEQTDWVSLAAPPSR